MSTGKVILGVIGGIVILGAIGSAMDSGKNSNSETVKHEAQEVTNGGSSSTQATSAPKQEQKEKLTITNSAFKDKGYGYYEVVGEAKNNDSAKHTATLKATFYGADGKIMGTASGALTEVAPGETKTFTLMGNDTVSGYKEMKVQVDTLL